MVTRAWRTGWPRYSWARPITQLLDEENTASLAHRQRMSDKVKTEADEQRDQARTRSVEARSEEMKMVELARKSVLGALVVSMELLPAMRTLGKLVSESIRDGAFKGPGGELIAMTLISKHATLMDKAAKATDAIVKLSRLDRDASTANVGLHIAVGVGSLPGMGDDELTYERALEIVESSADILDEVRKAGALPADLTDALATSTVVDSPASP